MLGSHCEYLYLKEDIFCLEDGTNDEVEYYSEWSWHEDPMETIEKNSNRFPALLFH